MVSSQFAVRMRPRTNPVATAPGTVPCAIASRVQPGTVLRAVASALVTVKLRGNETDSLRLVVLFPSLPAVAPTAAGQLNSQKTRVSGVQ